MKCPILTANKYQRGFNADLLFTGFRGKAIFWMGNDKEWSKMEDDNDIDDKINMEYQDNMLDDELDLI